MYEFCLILMGAGSVGLLVLLWSIIFCTEGTIELIKNPLDDYENPYILKFGADPTKWLSKSYVLLKVRKKN